MVKYISPVNILFVSKTSSRHLQDMYSRRLQDMPSRRLEDQQMFAGQRQTIRLELLKSINNFDPKIRNLSNDKLLYLLLH